MDFFVEQITASGTGKTDSSLNFCKGINILHGKSDSGKTMAANCIAYALGGADIPFSPEITGGYDTVTVSLRSYSGFKIEIKRVINTNKVVITSEHPEFHSGEFSLDAGDERSLNSVLLQLIGLDGSPMIGKNASSEKVHLTWKNLMKALYLDKDTMGKSYYVIEPESSYERTMLLSTLLYIIYGQDFSEKVPQIKDSIRKAQYEAKINYVLQKKSEFEKKKQIADEVLSKLAGDDVNNSVTNYIDYLSLIEKEIEQSINLSKQYYYEISDMEDQLKGNQFLLNRYESLKSQYVSDVKRLNSIIEGENALSAIPVAERCPFCDNPISLGHSKTHVDAAKNELQRIVSLLDGLQKTEDDVKAEIEKLQHGIDNLRINKKICEEGVDQELKPMAESLRRIIESYEESIRANQNLELYSQMIEELENDRCRLEEEEKANKTEAKKTKYKPKEFFKSDFVEALTRNAQDILQQCHYSKYNEASFDLDSFDIQVNGIDKSLIHGQGYCSFFNSVLFLVFRKCFYDKAQYKPGFLMIDTPLLGLVEKVGEPDPQEQKNYLYKYLADHKEEGQVIILDNTNELPGFLYDQKDISVIEFSESGRKGFLLDYS